MILSRLRDWLPSPRPPGPPIRATPAAALPELGLAETGLAEIGLASLAVRSAWPAERLAVADALWGAGFTLPGGEEEVLRLAKPLGLSAAVSVVLLGCGAGGAARCLAEELGAWVSGFEADPALVAAAADFCAKAGLGRRAQIERWDPLAPRFAPRAYHHALALEPLRGLDPERALAALAGALRAGSNLVMTEIVAGDPGEDTRFADWLRVEQREAPPAASAVTSVLERLGFEVRIAEDISQRHIQMTARSWRDLVRAIGPARPTPDRAAHLVAEAERWLSRARVMRGGRVRLMRWHAIGRGPNAG